MFRLFKNLAADAARTKIAPLVVFALFSPQGNPGRTQALHANAPPLPEGWGMGSHFLTLHVGSPAGISELMARDSPRAIDQIPDAETRRFAEKIMKGEYTRDPHTWEHPEGHMFIRAFQALSELSSRSRLTLEIYDDDERTPELWNFIWSDWEPAGTFALPLSPYGAPAVTYKDRGAVVKYLNQFKELRDAGGYDSSLVSPTDLDSLISVLETTAAQGPGVFVFIEY